MDINKKINFILPSVYFIVRLYPFLSTVIQEIFKFFYNPSPFIHLAKQDIQLPCMRRQRAFKYTAINRYSLYFFAIPAYLQEKKKKKKKIPTTR